MVFCLPSSGFSIYFQRLLIQAFGIYFLPTMLSADFSSFVVTTYSLMRPPRVSTPTFISCTHLIYYADFNGRTLDFCFLCNIIRLLSLVGDFCSLGRDFARSSFSLHLTMYTLIFAMILAPHLISGLAPVS